MRDRRYILWPCFVTWRRIALPCPTCPTCLCTTTYLQQTSIPTIILTRLLHIPPLLLLKMYHGPNAREAHHPTSTYPYRIWLTTPSLLLLAPPYGTSLPTLITAMIHFNT
jgi:hypothetical protein